MSVNQSFEVANVYVGRRVPIAEYEKVCMGNKWQTQ